MHQSSIGQKDMTAPSDWFNTEYKLVLRVRDVQGVMGMWVQMNQQAQIEMWELRKTPSKENVIKLVVYMLSFKWKWWYEF